MKNIDKVVIFGKTGKAKPGKFYSMTDLEELIEKIGIPLDNTVGTHLAVQTLLYNYPVLYYPVIEEGSSKKCYNSGMKALFKSKQADEVIAIVMPGFGSKPVLDLALDFCSEKKCVLILNEADYYDFLSEDDEIEIIEEIDPDS